MTSVDRFGHFPLFPLFPLFFPFFFSFFSFFFFSFFFLQHLLGCFSSILCNARELDSSDHHRTICAVAGVLGRRGFAVESVAARVCREAGARVSLNVRVEDMDLALRAFLTTDVWRSCQLAVDTTVVSVFRRDGTPHPRCGRCSS